MENITAEVSGPVLATLHHQFAESRGDFMAILLGCVSVKNYSENTDLATKTEKRRTRVVVQDWVIASMEQVIDFKTGGLKIDALNKLVEDKRDLKFVGMLKFKKTMNVDSEPSFLDKRVMSAVLKSCSWQHPRPHLYLLVGEGVTTHTLSIKYSMTTFLLEHERDCPDGPWSRKTPLVVPNLGTDQRVEYMKSGGGGSETLKELVEGTKLGSIVVDVNKNFQPLNARFQAGMEQVSDRIMKLDKTRASLEEELMVLNQMVNERLELNREMKLIKGLQGDLKAALEVNWEEPDVKNKFEEKMNSMKLELSEDEDE